MRAIGPRGYYRYPWPRRAVLLLPVLAVGRSFRAISRELAERRLTERRVDPATVRRAVLRVGGRP